MPQYLGPERSWPVVVSSNPDGGGQMLSYVGSGLFQGGRIASPVVKILRVSHRPDNHAGRSGCHY
ncbi:MAG: hypothetical protein WCH99_05645 [Verrucomicrobiota bacterium]